MKLKFISKIIIAISSIFLIIALYSLGKSLLLKIAGTETDGIIYSYKYDPEGLSKDYTTFFKTKTGDSIGFKNSFHYVWDRRYQKGEIVKVLYMESNANIAKINTASEMFGNLLLYLFLFIVFFLLGLFVNMYDERTYNDS